MRQRRLVDHADRPAVRLEPDAAHGFAVDFHDCSTYQISARLSMLQITRARHHLPARSAYAAISPCECAGDAGGRHRLRSRIRQSRPRAGTSGDFCPLDARSRELSRRDAKGRTRRARPVLWRYAAAMHRLCSCRKPARTRRWRSSFTAAGGARSIRRMFSQMARGPNARGVAVAVAGYDLCPNVTIADIIEQMRRACAFLWQRFGRRMLVYGHSAGGHLAAPWSRPTGPRFIPRRRPIWCRPAMRFPACSI